MGAAPDGEELDTACNISSPNIEAYNDSQSQPIIRSHDNLLYLVDRYVSKCTNAIGSC